MTPSSPSPSEHIKRALPHWLSYTPQEGLMWGVSRGTCVLLRHWVVDWGCWCPRGLTSPPEEVVPGMRWMGWAVRRVRHVTAAALIAAGDTAEKLPLLLPLQLLHYICCHYKALTLLRQLLPTQHKKQQQQQQQVQIHCHCAAAAVSSCSTNVNSENITFRHNNIQPSCNIFFTFKFKT